MNITAQDQENATKASHSASFLVSDLRELVASKNLLISDVAMDLLDRSVEIERYLSRMVEALK